jgi:hypothetical protein
MYEFLVVAEVDDIAGGTVPIANACFNLSAADELSLWLLLLLLLLLFVTDAVDDAVTASSGCCCLALAFFFPVRIPDNMLLL